MIVDTRCGEKTPLDNCLLHVFSSCSFVTQNHQYAMYASWLVAYWRLECRLRSQVTELLSDEAQLIWLFL